MPILRTNRYSVAAPAIVEDPTPGANIIFLQNEAYDSATLNHLFNKTISYNVAGTGYSAFGQVNFQANQDPTGRQGLMILNGEVTHCKHVIFNTNNDWRNSLDQSPFASMDRRFPVKWARYDTFAGGNSTTLMYEIYGTAAGSNGNQVYHNGTRPPGADLSVGFPNQNANQGTPYTFRPVYFNPNTGNIICVGEHNASGFQPGGWIGFSMSGNVTGTAPVTVPVINPNGVTQVANVTCQFIGPSLLSGQAVYLHNNLSGDITQNIYRYNDFGNTAVTLNTFSVAPAGTTATGGTSWGGDRSVLLGNPVPKFASSIFTATNTASTMAFYVPYFDTVGNFQPWYFRWNQVQDTFTRLQVTSTTYSPGLRLQDVWSFDGFSLSSVNVNYGMQRAWYNETFNGSDGNRYLTLMQLHGAGGVYDTTATMRSFVTFTVDPADQTRLAYHSAVVIPQTPKNIVWLSDDHTVLGIFTHTIFYIYRFVPPTGWTQTASYPFQFGAVGRDSRNRIWAVDNGPLSGGRIHLLQGQNTPTTISVVPSTSTFNFSGSPIPVELSVDTFDSAGSRLVNNVTLTTVGTSLVLLTTSSQSVTSITVATNALSSTIVQARVVGPGTTGLTANITI